MRRHMSARPEMTARPGAQAFAGPALAARRQVEAGRNLKAAGAAAMAKFIASPVRLRGSIDDAALRALSLKKGAANMGRHQSEGRSADIFQQAKHRDQHGDGDDDVGDIDTALCDHDLFVAVDLGHNSAPLRFRLRNYRSQRAIGRAVPAKERGD
jgi:hypothetical protein